MGALFLNKYVIGLGLSLVVVIGAYSYVKVSANTIRGLRDKVTILAIQTDNLQKANEAMQRDIELVQQTQAETNEKLNAIRVAASQALRELASRKFEAKNVGPLTVQINKETADMFHRLETLSHGP